MSADLSPIIDLLSKADEIAASIGYPDPSLHHEYHRQVVMLVSQAYVQLFGTRIEHPDWVLHTGPLFPWGAPNHDTIYGFAPMDARGTYRVSGLKGTEIIASLMFRQGGANTGEVHGATLGEIDIQAVPCGGDKRFSLVLSNERPSGYSGAWYPIPAATTGILARHVTAEPTQVDGVWSIERLDTPPASVVRTPEQIKHNFELMTRFALRLNELLLRLVKKLRDAGAVNRFVPERFQGNGGIALQMYYQSLFELGEGEALILESEVPDSVLYWSVQLLDPFYSAIDFTFHAAARNHRQSRVDQDSKIRFVICAQDPGVPNWLDPAGWRQGGMLWRWHSSSSAPEPTVRKIKFSELRSNLPTDTPTIDAAARKTELASRIHHYQSRRRW